MTTSETGACGRAASTSLALVLGVAAVSAGPADVLRDLPARPARAVRLVVVRHGEAYSNLPHEPGKGLRDYDRLTPRGHAQARAAGQALAGLGISLVVTSPARRTRETAEDILAMIGPVPLEIDARLQPLRQGRGRDGHHLSWAERAAAWKKGQDPAPAGGESLQQLGGRAGDFAEDLAEDVLAHGRGATILLVTHSEVVASLLGVLEGRPPLRLITPGVHNASITVVEVSPGGGMRILARDRVPWTP